MYYQFQVLYSNRKELHHIDRVFCIPKIAKLYCVTTDDFFKETSIAYENYAQRLAAIYESTPIKYTPTKYTLKNRSP